MFILFIQYACAGCGTSAPTTQSLAPATSDEERNRSVRKHKSEIKGSGLAFYKPFEGL